MIADHIVVRDWQPDNIWLSLGDQLRGEPHTPVAIHPLCFLKKFDYAESFFRDTQEDIKARFSEHWKVRRSLIDMLKPVDTRSVLVDGRADAVVLPTTQDLIGCIYFMHDFWRDRNGGILTFRESNSYPSVQIVPRPNTLVIYRNQRPEEVRVTRIRRGPYHMLHWRFGVA